MTDERGNPGYSPDERSDIQGRICLGLMVGKSLKSILDNDPTMPTRETIYRWLHEDVDFHDNYTRAREAQADYFADEIANIADTEPDPNKARVRIDARKWAAGKLKPKVYGDKLDVTGIDLKLSDEQLESRLTFVLRKAGAIAAAGGEGTPDPAQEVLQHVPGDGTTKA